MTRFDDGLISRVLRATPALVAVLLLLAIPGRTLAAGDSLVALFVGTQEADGVTLQQVVLRLDGQAVTIPATPPAAEQPAVEVPTGAGRHGVDVEIRLDGHSTFFPYLDDYRFMLRGHLDVEARRGEVVAVQGLVRRKSGFLVPWESQYSLALSATSYPSDRAASPVAAPAPVPVAVAVARPAEPKAAVARVACTLQPVTFAFGKAALSPSATRALDAFAACLGKDGGGVRLEGHCDQRGATELNLKLGERRADRVARYLRGKGVAEASLSTLSWGKSRPVCEERSEPCHARNRRVEAVLLAP
jgi:peptidoglycan-associated lipoprotein